MEKGNRKRKQSADTKTVKKRKTKGDDNGNNLQPLALAEAPIRLNIDSLTPLGGKSKLKKTRGYSMFSKFGKFSTKKPLFFIDLDYNFRWYSGEIR